MDSNDKYQYGQDRIAHKTRARIIAVENGWIVMLGATYDTGLCTTDEKTFVYPTMAALCADLPNRMVPDPKP